MRSVVAQNPISHNSNELDSSHVMYSLNKRKRWLLPEQIKDEIRNEHRINKEVSTVVFLFFPLSR